MTAERTDANIETMGLMMGYTYEDRMVVETLYVPFQYANSYLCKIPTHESQELVEYVDENNYNCLIWIHTHPQYGNFLSSCDVHNQNGYQQLNEHFAAAVYSGKNDSIFFYRNKTDKLKTIASCKKKSFHGDGKGHGPMQDCDYEIATNISITTDQPW